jgi:hypothetical protein
VCNGVVAAGAGRSTSWDDVAGQQVDNFGLEGSRLTSSSGCRRCQVLTLKPRRPLLLHSFMKACRYWRGCCLNMLTCLYIAHRHVQAAKDLLQELVVWPMLNPVLCQVRSRV